MIQLLVANMTIFRGEKRYELEKALEKAAIYKRGVG